MTEVLPTVNVRNEGIEDFYDIGQEIGSGQFAVVKNLTEKSSGREFAAKFMKKKRSKASRRGMTSEQILREAHVLRSVNHEGIIYLHDVFETKLEFILVLELLSGGELFEFLSEQEYLTEDEAVGFLKQVIEAIEYLHQKSIVHLDIKPENIVLKCEGSSQIKLIDFGLARKLAKGEMVREIMGTPEFVAPEIIAFEPVGTETDMWAIGVLTYIMLSGASPFLGDNDTETFNNISHVDYEFDDEYFKDISPPAKEFISDLLLKSTKERMSAGECLKHEWMQEQDDASGESEEDDRVYNLHNTTDTSRSRLNKRRSTQIRTEAFKKFTARARWQKSVNKLIAISRLALLGKKSGPQSKGVLLQPNESDTSSDTENHNEPQSIPLERLADSDRESASESANEEESVCSTDSGRAANEEESEQAIMTDPVSSTNDQQSEEVTMTTKNGSENGRQSHQNEANEARSGDENPESNEISSPESKPSSKRESKDEIIGGLNGEKRLNEDQPEVDTSRGFRYRSGRIDRTLQKEQPKPVLPVVKPVQPVLKSLVEEKDRQKDEPVLPDAKPVQPVLKSKDVYESNTKHRAVEPKLEVKAERRIFDVNQRYLEATSKRNDTKTVGKQENTKSGSKFLFHDKKKDGKPAKKPEPTKMKAGKFESLLSKFSKSHAANEESTKDNKYAKEARRSTSGSVKDRITNEGFGESRVRRKSDQMGSKIDWQAIRAATDEKLEGNPLRRNQQAKPSEVLARSSQSYRERTGKEEGFEPNEKIETKYPAEKVSLIEKAVTKTEIRKTFSSNFAGDGDSSSKPDDASVWLRRSTTSHVERKRKDSPYNRRGLLGLSHTSTKAEVMKWEQRQNDGEESSPVRPRSSPLKPTMSVTDRSFSKERQKIDTPVYNTTLTVKTKDKREISSEPVGIGNAVKDREHTLFVKTSQKTIDSEAKSGVSKKWRDSDTKVSDRLGRQENGKPVVETTGKDSNMVELKTEGRKDNLSLRHEYSRNPVVENAGKDKNMVENPQHEPRKAENKTSKHKKKERREVKTKIQSGNTSSVFPEFALTFERIIPTANALPAGDDDFVWVMTSETNPSLELLTGALAPPKKSKSHSRRKSTRSSEADTEPTIRHNSGGRSRTKSSETDTERPSVLENSGSRSTKFNEVTAEPTVRVDSGIRRRSARSSEAKTESSEHMASGGRRRRAKSSGSENEPGVFESSSSTGTKSSGVKTESTVRIESGETKVHDGSSEVKLIPMASGVTTLNFTFNSEGLKLH